MRGPENMASDSEPRKIFIEAPDNKPCWTRRGRPRHTWVRQVESDAGISADDAWDTACRRSV